MVTLSVFAVIGAVMLFLLVLFERDYRPSRRSYLVVVGIVVLNAIVEVGRDLGW